MKLTSRKDVYNLIDGERDYQDQKWPTSCHNYGNWLLFIEDYLNEAKHIWTRETEPVATEKVGDIMRKIAAMAVCSIEENGAPPRAKL